MKVIYETRKNYYDEDLSCRVDFDVYLSEMSEVYAVIVVKITEDELNTEIYSYRNFLEAVKKYKELGGKVR